MKRSQLDKAIAQLESERQVIDLAIERLKAQQQQVQPKPRRVKARASAPAPAERVS